MLKKITLMSFLAVIHISCMENEANNLITVKNSTETTLELAAKKSIDGDTSKFTIAPGETKTIAALIISYKNEPTINQDGCSNGYGLFFMTDSELVNDPSKQRITFKKLVTK